MAVGKVSACSVPVTIYALVDPRSDQIFYVGKTENELQVRLRGHICDALAGRSSSASVIQEIVSAGLRPSIRVIEVVSFGEWAVAERKWIAHFRSFGLLCNRAKGGEGPSGVLRTKETVLKIIESRRRSGRGAEGAKRAAEKNRGRKQSEDERAHRSRIMKGRRPSDAAIAATGARYRGKKLSRNAAHNAGNAWRGKTQSAEHGEKKRWSMRRHQAKQSSDQVSRWRDPQYRAAVIASMSGTKRTPEHRNNIGKASTRSWMNPATRLARINRSKAGNTKPQTRAQHSERTKALWADPVWRAAMLRARASKSPD
jgi:hypothetical protein